MKSVIKKKKEKKITFLLMRCKGDAALNKVCIVHPNVGTKERKQALLDEYNFFFVRRSDFTATEEQEEEQQEQEKGLLWKGGRRGGSGDQKVHENEILLGDWICKLK